VRGDLELDRAKAAEETARRQHCEEEIALLEKHKAQLDSQLARRLEEHSQLQGRLSAQSQQTSTLAE
jgi:hypothetical protein